MPASCPANLFLQLWVLTDTKSSKVNRAPALSIVVRISKEPFLNCLRSGSHFTIFGTDSSAGVDPLAWSQTAVYQSRSWSILTSTSKQSWADNKMRDVIWVYWPQKNISEGLLGWDQGEKNTCISGSVCQNMGRDSGLSRDRPLQDRIFE
jgi:hypothetical protein